MRGRLFRPWAALALLVAVSGVWAQSRDAASAQSGGIDPALLAKATAGDASAQERVADAFGNGEGIPQDYAQAAVWYRKAAEQGNPDAQSHLALLYVNGQGVSQDFAQAAVWFTKAAEQGVADAQYNLGTAYSHGQGVPQDYGQAAVSGVNYSFRSTTTIIPDSCCNLVLSSLC